MKWILILIFNPLFIYYFFSAGVVLSTTLGWLIYFLFKIKEGRHYNYSLVCFFILIFSFIPFLQLSTKSYMYLEPVDGDSTATVVWFLLVLSFLVVIKASNLFEKLSLDFHICSINKPSALFYAITFFSGACYLYFIFIFGGVEGLLNDYDTRLETSVTEHNSLKGYGVLQAFSNVFPVYFFLISIFFLKKKSIYIFVFLTVISVVLSFFVSGVFGSRQGIIFVVWACFWIWHRFVFSFKSYQIKLFCFFSVMIMLVLMPLKFFGSEASIEKLMDFNDERQVEVIAGPLGFFILRDIGRFDVQNVVVESLLDSSLDIQYGKTILGGALAAIPSSILPFEIWSPTDVKNEIFFGSMWEYFSGTTLLVGLPGEFIINFGYLGYVFFGFLFIIVIKLIMFINRAARYDGRFALFEIFILPLPFLMFIFDSNVISFYVFKWIVLFSFLTFVVIGKNNSRLKVFV